MIFERYVARSMMVIAIIFGSSSFIVPFSEIANAQSPLRDSLSNYQRDLSCALWRKAASDDIGESTVRFIESKLDCVVAELSDKIQSQNDRGLNVSRIAGQNILYNSVTGRFYTNTTHPEAAMVNVNIRSIADQEVTYFPGYGFRCNNMSLWTIR